MHGCVGVISFTCTLYFTYQELFVRLIRQPIEESRLNDDAEKESPQTKINRKTELFESLKEYMNSKRRVTTSSTLLEYTAIPIGEAFYEIAKKL